MTALVDRLFAPHGADAYLRWLTPRSARAVYSGVAVAPPRNPRPAAESSVDTVSTEGTTFARSGVTSDHDGTLLEVAEAAGLKTWVIGDAIQPGKVDQATRSAYLAGIEVGR